MSCHSTAEAPTLSPQSPLFQAASSIPPEGSTQWMRWFTNINCGVAFDSKAKSADYSLQLALGIANFEQWYTEGGLYASQYTNRAATANAAAKLLRLGAPSSKVPSPAGQKVYPITRDLAEPAGAK
jgi:hypothetical protein